jgi:hypothetical protein
VLSFQSTDLVVPYHTAQSGDKTLGREASDQHPWGY